MPCLLNYSIIQCVIYSFRYPECPQKYIFISHWIVSCCFRQFAAWMNCNRKSTTQTEKWIWFRKMISESAIYHYELIIEHCNTKYSDARYRSQGYVFDEHDCDVIFHWLIPCSHFWDNEKKNYPWFALTPAASIPMSLAILHVEIQTLYYNGIRYPHEKGCIKAILLWGVHAKSVKLNWV